MPTYKEILIDWSPLVKVEALSENSLEYNNILYQIYGDSHIYGRNVLLYIGKSVNAAERMYQHVKGVFGYVNNLQVSIGTVSNFDGALEVPESILIANHKPSFNKEYIHDLDPKAKGKDNKIILINNGINYMLKTSCTNYWWVENIENETISEKKGKSEFSPSEIIQIIRLIDQKVLASTNEQKTLRDKIRKIGFYATDFGIGGGYTSEDFLNVINSEI